MIRALLLLAALFGLGADAFAAQMKSCTLMSIHDGDTVRLRCGQKEIKVRLHCVDAPELAQSPWGERARTALANLIGGGYRTLAHGDTDSLIPYTPLVLQLEAVELDRYGRTVGNLYRGKQWLNLEMVRTGALAVYPQYCDDPRFDAAQREAKGAKLGIWKSPGLHRTPWRWRH